MTFSAHPLVSIVVPFYNCPYIDQCLHSILMQHYPHIEIIVVDDGSTMHREKLEPYFGRIRCIRKTNGGTANALNVGIRAAQGEYVAWLSSDDRIFPGKISIQVNYMMQHQAPISFTNFHAIDANNQILEPYAAVTFPTAKQFIEAFLRFCPVNGSTVMMHRSLPYRIGWFDESLLCTQDYDFWIRVHLARVDFHFINEALTLYRWHNGMGTRRMSGKGIRESVQVRDRYAHHIHALLNLL
jgi:glycosyltransferase involved in cell wall biosynthesis